MELGPVVGGGEEREFEYEAVAGFGLGIDTVEVVEGAVGRGMDLTGVEGEGQASELQGAFGDW